MPTKKLQKYKNPAQVAADGVRRLSKKELRALGYSEKTKLYTARGVKNPSRFLTRRDVERYEAPTYARREASKPAYVRAKPFAQLEKNKIDIERELYRYKHTIYADFKNPISLAEARGLIAKYFDYLQNKYRPDDKRNSVMLEITTINDRFFVGPAVWMRRNVLFSRIQETVEFNPSGRAFRRGNNVQENKAAIIFIIGWFEGSK